MLASVVACTPAGSMGPPSTYSPPASESRPAQPPAPTDTAPRPAAVSTAQSDPPVAVPRKRPPAPAPKLRTVELAFTGDILLHTPVVARSLIPGDMGPVYDFRPMFAQVRDELSKADIAICHLETPLSADNSALSGYPRFNVPSDLAAALSYAGYDGCSTASNHSLDRGTVGIAQTLGVLDRHGLEHAGMARTASEAALPTIYHSNEIPIAHLSYTYGLNGIPLPADSSWAVNLISADTIKAEADRAVRLGARFVVLSIHWGTEYTSTPSRSQRDLAHYLLSDTAVDLIIGTHSHVPQPIEQIGDKYVAYGLGNFLSNQSGLTNRSYPLSVADGLILKVSLRESPTGQITAQRLHAVPTYVDRPGYVIVDTAEALSSQPQPRRRAALESSWHRTADVLRRELPDLQIKGDRAPAPVSGAPDTDALQ